MICKNCSSENLDWASYCSQCGAALGQLCECSFRNQPADFFCAGCGIPLHETTKTKKNSSEKAHSLVKQFSKKEVSELIQESIYFRMSDDKNLNQSEIDNIFIINHEIENK